jgi:hypothetical protein
VANIVLRDAIVRESGFSMAGQGLWDPEVLFQELTSLLNSFVRGRNAHARLLVVVSAHKNEELCALGLIRMVVANIGVEEYAEGMMRVALFANGSGNKVPEPGGF